MKRKQKEDKSQEENDKRVKVSKAKPDLVKNDLEGWSSAAQTGDLKGPFIILAMVNDEIRIIEVGDGDIDVGNKVRLVDRESNLFGQLTYEEIHKAEPTTINQVLTFVPIQEKKKSVLDTTTTEKFAFRTHRRTYFSSSFSEEYAIGKNEIFLFKFVALHSQECNYDLPNWRIFNGEKQLVLKAKEDSTIEPLMVQEGSIYPHPSYVSEFIIRVHASNTVEGAQRALNMASETKLTTDPDQEIRKLLHELHKDSGGKIKIDTALVTRLRVALSNGNINEQMIEERSKVMSKG